MGNVFPCCRQMYRADGETGGRYFYHESRLGLFLNMFPTNSLVSDGASPEALWEFEQGGMPNFISVL